MDYRNNPRHDRKRLIDFLEKFALEYYESNTPHEEPVKITVPEIELSPDSSDLYTSYSWFLSANRRSILTEFSKLQFPCGMIVQLEIDYEVRICISYVI
jgi:hypothetical protein